VAEPSILFIDASGHHVAKIAQDLSERGFSIIANGGFSDLVPGAENWDSFVPANALQLATANLESFVDGISLRLSTTEGQKTFAHPRGQFLLRTGSRFLQNLVNFRSTQIQTIETLENLAKKKHLGAIVLGCDNSHVQRTIVMHAKKLGIPTVQLAHGIYGSMKHLSYAANMDHLYADYIAAFGDRAEEHMVKLGNDAKRIVKVGSPAWDVMSANADRPNKTAAAWQLGLPVGGKVVLFTCSYAEAGSAFFRQMTRRFVEVHKALARAMRELGDDVTFILRPHPTELNRSGKTAAEQAAIAGAYLAWIERMSGTKPRLSTGDLDLAIKASDVVVATGSSAVLGGAIHLDRPTINIPLIEGEEPTFTKEDGVVFAEDHEIGARIEELLFNHTARQNSLKTQRRALQRLNIGYDGTSAKRTVEFLADLALGETEEETSDVTHELAIQAAESGDLDRAMQILGKLIEHESGKVEMRAELFNDRGVVRHHSGQFQGALDDLTESLKLRPLDKTVLENLNALLQDENARRKFSAAVLVEAH
jgi:tetratricopeptide (TPR) repeat protein